MEASLLVSAQPSPQIAQTCCRIGNTAAQLCYSVPGGCFTC